MSQNKITGKQIWCWLTLAMAAPLMQTATKGYMVTALAVGAMLPLTLLVKDGYRAMGRVVSVLEWILVVLILARLLPAAGSYWPGERAQTVVGLIVLALAAITAGAERKAGACGALCWLAGGALALVAVKGIGAVQTVWLRPQPGDWSGELLITLLLPALVGAVDGNQRRKTTAVGLIGLIALGISALIQGLLGFKGAAGVPAPLYEGARSLGSGVELLVSVGATMSWYALACLLVGSGENFLEKTGINGRTSTILTGSAAGGLILLDWSPDGWLLFFGCLMGWIMLPILHGKIK